MYIDYENRFSNNQAITGDAASTNIIDLGAVDSKVQSYNKKGAARLVVMATENFTLLTNLIISLRTAATKTGTVDNSSLTTPTTIMSKTVVLADLIVGKPLIDQELPLGMLQYADLYFDVTGTNPDAGKITAFIAYDTQSNNM